MQSNKYLNAATVEVTQAAKRGGGGYDVGGYLCRQALVDRLSGHHGLR